MSCKYKHFFRVSLQNITDINSKYKKYTIATAKANSNDSISYFLLLNVSLKEYFFNLSVNIVIYSILQANEQTHSSVIHFFCEFPNSATNNHVHEK